MVLSRLFDGHASSVNYIKLKGCQYRQRHFAQRVQTRDTKRVKTAEVEMKIGFPCFYQREHLLECPQVQVWNCAGNLS